MHTEPNPTTNTRGAPPPSTHEARRTADSRAAEAGHARDALAAAERGEAIAREAHAAATAAADEAAAEHAKAAAAQEKAEASYAETQTAASWSGVERTRTLAAQVQLRAQRAAVAREAAASDLAAAMRRAVAARTEYLRAEDAAQRAADVLRGLEHNARLADDAAAAREGARLRAVAQYAAERDAFATAYSADVAPLVAAAVDALRALDTSARSLAAGIEARAVEAARIVAAGRACGALRPDETPDALAVPRSLADVLGAAVAAAGLAAGILSPLARRGGASPAVAALLASAGVEAPEVDAPSLGALLGELSALHRATQNPRFAVAWGDAERAKVAGKPAQTAAIRCAGALFGAADGAIASVMHDTAPAAAPRVEAAIAEARERVEFALRFLAPGVWRW